MGNCIITRRVYGEAVVPKVPVLNANFPEDHTYNRVTQEDPATIELTVIISEAGIPAEYSYQWYKNGTKIDEATNENYIINSNEFVLGQTRYYCMVSNAAGVVQSKESIITFQDKPTLNSSYPADSTLAAASGATVSVAVNSGYPTNYTYQWYKNGTIISGANSSSYNISSVGMGQSTYYCAVTNSVGTTNSRTCTITGIQKPVLTASLPADVTITASAAGQAVFSVGISSQGYPTNYTYQWYKNNSPIGGATGSSYTATGLTAQQNATFYCIVTNSAGAVQSRTATLTVQSYLPVYTYTGQHQLIDDGNFNWRIKFLTTGTLTFSSLGNITGKGLTAFLVGGGGGGGCAGGGGGGGYTAMTTAFPTLNTPYQVIVGAGGAGGSGDNGPGGGGGSSSIMGTTASGGAGGGGWNKNPNGGNGGSGGAGHTNRDGNIAGSSGGSDGGNGDSSYDFMGGTGMGTPSATGIYYVREFREVSGALYSGGGGGGATWGNLPGGGGGNGGGGQGGGSTTGGTGGAGTENTGGGGGGGRSYSSMNGGKGGSGIVIIRNAR